jgi:uncharacterized protein
VALLRSRAFGTARKEPRPKKAGASYISPRHMLTADQIKEFLKLRPLPVEGGFFSEAYRSEHKLPTDAMPPSYPGERALSTAIYYLLTPETFSALHRLRGDEVFHFYLGDPVEMLLLKEDGTAHTAVLGRDISAGMRLQHVVPAGTWQGSRLVPGGKYALMGTTMSPGFDRQDYEPGQRDELSARFPRYAQLIAMLTR